MSGPSVKVETAVTVQGRDGRGQGFSLAPGIHSLARELAEDLIARGHAVAVGGDAQADAGNSNPSGGQGGDGKGRPLLQNPIPVIVEGLGKLSADELDELAKEESAKGEKARKGVLDAIEAAKAALK